MALLPSCMFEQCLETRYMPVESTVSETININDYNDYTSG